jgi:opacity protein-like surface antigen
MRRRLHTAVVAGTLLLVAGTSPALAQDKSWGGFIGFGGSFPMSDSKDSFDSGWNFTGGVAWNLSESFSLQADYSFNRHGLSPARLEATPLDLVSALDGSYTQQNLFLNAVVFTNGSDNSSLYLLGGGGATHRNVEITRFAGYAGGIVCNPWWLVCFPGVVPVEQVLGSRSTWDPGANVGVGFQIDLGGGSGGSKFFLEARYHYIRGDEFENPTNETERSNTQSVSVSGGFRF